MLHIPRSSASGLRDIRPDLRERLRVAKSDLSQVQAMIGTLESTVGLLEQMLAQEEQRYAASEKSVPSESLPEFLLEKLRSGPHTKDVLRWAAEQAGYDVDGRSIHATLVNLIRTDRAVEVREGEYSART
jgi:hypothetical protein